MKPERIRVHGLAGDSGDSGPASVGLADAVGVQYVNPGELKCTRKTLTENPAFLPVNASNPQPLVWTVRLALFVAAPTAAGESLGWHRSTNNLRKAGAAD